MKWVVIVVRTLVGAGFILTGLDGFLHFLKIVPPSGDALTFLMLLVNSGYLHVVKACEVVGGGLLISGRMAPLGLTLLMPVAVNILLYEACLLRQPGPGFVLVPLLAFLIWGYRGAFKSFFTTEAKIGA